jgi:hypothetical protein
VTSEQSKSLPSIARLCVDSQKSKEQELVFLTSLGALLQKENDEAILQGMKALSDTPYFRYYWEMVGRVSCEVRFVSPQNTSTLAQLFAIPVVVQPTRPGPTITLGDILDRVNYTSLLELLKQITVFQDASLLLINSAYRAESLKTLTPSQIRSLVCDSIKTYVNPARKITVPTSPISSEEEIHVDDPELFYILGVAQVKNSALFTRFSQDEIQQYNLNLQLLFDDMFSREGLNLRCRTFPPNLMHRSIRTGLQMLRHTEFTTFLNKHLRDVTIQHAQQNAIVSHFYQHDNSVMVSLPNGQDYVWAVDDMEYSINIIHLILDILKRFNIKVDEHIVH